MVTDAESQKINLQMNIKLKFWEMSTRNEIYSHVINSDLINHLLKSILFYNYRKLLGIISENLWNQFKYLL